MKLRRLGNSDLAVSPIILGAWAIGGWMWGGSDEKDALEAIHKSLDCDITTIDTAPIYGMGYSEEIVGKAIKGKRNQVVIATKCGMRWDSEEGADPWSHVDRQGNPVVIRKNSKPESILYECEQSLKRLGVEAIDLYQIHWPDATTPFEESWEAMAKLKKQGKVKAIGVSNYDVPALERIQKIHQVDSCQPPYSALRRGIEQDLIPFCKKNGIGVIVYSPLERGLLTGAVTMERQFPETDHRSRHPLFALENRQKVLKVLEDIQPLAKKHQRSLAQLMIHWTICQEGITAALVGARNAQQAQHNAMAATFSLTTEEQQQLRHAFDELIEELKQKGSLS